MPFNLKQAVRTGLSGGAVVLLMALIGMFEAFAKRNIVDGVVTLGALLFAVALMLTSFSAVRRAGRGPVVLGYGALAGLTATLPLAAMLLLNRLFELKAMFVNVTAEMLNLLTFGQGVPNGLVALLGLGLVLGLTGALLQLLPSPVRRPLLVAVGWVTISGVLQELIRVTASNIGALAALTKSLYSDNGLTPGGATAIFITVGVLNIAWGLLRPRLQASAQALPASGQRALRWGGGGLALLALFVVPKALGDIYIAEVLNQVGLYVLMGLGLNIVVGFAGLLDLGYVAFFAIGAYTVGVLTSPDRGGQFVFWTALPFAVAVAILFGFILGIPVLKIRGDYLAIVTLGFGEIIRLLALSDFLKPFLGGSQGILSIPKAQIGAVSFDGPIEIYYIILIGCLAGVFIARRLKDSRMGRAWMAIREDEDVAQAMGIDMVWTKLLAFAMGAAFAGASGAIFASKLSAIYPVSFKLDISINVLALLIIGGMGSIPGVIVGALALIGLPELLREFEDYRLLVYGATLVLMMQLRPEGLLPSALRQRELHEQAEEAPVIVADAMPAATD
jgi:branched-chain amino acid transport system permease protein